MEALEHTCGGSERGMPSQATSMRDARERSAHCICVPISLGLPSRDGTGSDLASDSPRRTGLPHRGLKGPNVLGKDRPHGERIRYLAGCRCALCRKANSNYANERAAAIRAGDWNGIVSAQKARTHLATLSAHGIGRRTVSNITGVSETCISAITSGQKIKIRAKTEKLILAVTTQCQADGALISAKPSWKLINELLKDGYTKSDIARAMGFERPVLQLGRTHCTVLNAAIVQRVFDRLRKCSARPSIRLLKELKEEGFRQVVIDAAVTRAAASLGLPGVPAMEITNNRIRVDAARLIAAAYQELMGDYT